MKLKAGHYLTTYISPPEISNLLNLQPRHDHNATVWFLSADGRLELQRHWEFERFSGYKHHGVTAPNLEALREFLGVLLKKVGLLWQDILGCWGTAGLEVGTTPESPDQRFSIHTMAHLFSVMANDTFRLNNGVTLGFGLDGGPDHMLGRTRHQYVGAVARDGHFSYFPAESPGRLFDAASKLYGLEAGSLMALATASDATVEIDVTRYLDNSQFCDAYPAETMDVYATAERVVKDIDRLVVRCLTTLENTGFTSEEQTASATMKVVQSMSTTILARNVDRAIQEFEIRPTQTSLAMAGGFALNCPANSWLMEKYRFKSFFGSPCANDAGQSIGLGLMGFHGLLGPDLVTSEAGAFLGEGIDDLNKTLADLSEHIDSVSTDIDRFVDDVIRQPVAWVEGRAEAGPRALGHRSLLCDPRSQKGRDQLNLIKHRQWWRPVAPIVLRERFEDFFRNASDSPFMLRTFDVRPDQQHRIPGVLHLDGTARCQTIGPEVGLLYDMIQNYARKTGIPMLGNTSLNDKGQPIVQTAAETIAFCIARKVQVVYIDGFRIELNSKPTNGLVKKSRRTWTEASMDEFPTDSGNPFKLAPADLYFLATQIDLQRTCDLKTQAGASAVRIAAAAHYQLFPADLSWVESFVTRKQISK
jgi:carbamoyltransferase